MSNQTLFIFFFPSFSDLLPHLIFAGVMFWVFGLVALISYVKNRQGDARAEIEPLCVWRYSAAEWQKYAANYDLAKFPKGEARAQTVPIGMERDVVEITKLFSENIARQNKKVASVMPDDFFNGLLGEANF